MRGAIAFFVTIIFMLSIAASVLAEKPEDRGKALFQQHCAPCHANGGNIVNPKKTLHKADREANKVKNAADIVRNMRNPGPGMTKFDKNVIPDKDAKLIADYILKTFR